MKGRISRILVGVAGVIVAGVIAGACSKTVSEQSSVVKSMQEGPTAAASGFFGSDVSLLQPGGEGKAAMVYLNPNAQWKQYTKIMIEPVEFWDDPDTGVSPADQHILTAYFYNALKEQLQKNFTIVDQGGPGVLQLQVALTNASAATPGLRTVSVVIPQARILTAGASLATGSYVFAGSAQAEMKLTDSATGQLLGAAIDKRAGGMSITNATSFRWGDAENAMNFWAEKISSRLLELQGRQPAAT